MCWVTNWDTHMVHIWTPLTSLVVTLSISGLVPGSTTYLAIVRSPKVVGE